MGEVRGDKVSLEKGRGFGGTRGGDETLTRDAFFLGFAKVILNLYKPGVRPSPAFPLFAPHSSFSFLKLSRSFLATQQQGITPHIDLPHRYDTPILSVSLLSGTSFLLRRPRDDETEWTEHRFWLPEGSVLILDGEARWEWEHGIEVRFSVQPFLFLFYFSQFFYQKRKNMC